MPPLTDRATIQKMLDADRDWAAYAIGDLAPALVEHCEWYAPSDDPPALLLIYRGFSPPIAFAMGAPAQLRRLFAEVTAPQLSLQVKPEALDALAGIYSPSDIRTMQRMTLRPTLFKPAGGEVSHLGLEHRAAVQALYDDGHRRGEGPTFFAPSMLAQGTFRGIWEEGALIAIAGTHLYSSDLGVSAIGNVYTRSDRRGRGLGGRATSAVVAQAIADGVRTIVLNVGRDNLAAVRVYQRLGFVRHCDFVEGLATRADPPPAGPSRR